MPAPVPVPAYGGTSESAAHAPLHLLLDAGLRIGAKPEGGHYFWTTRELEVLRTTFASGGVPACLPLLPGRSASSIYQKAGLLGLKRPGANGAPRTRQRYETSDELDAAIRRAYAGERPTREAIQALCRATGRPRRWITSRARLLGLGTLRHKPAPWSDAELAILREAGAIHPDRVRLKLKAIGSARSIVAILVKRRDLRILQDRDSDGAMTATGLAECFGVDRGTVSSWAEKGLLPGKRAKAFSVPERRAAHENADWRFTDRDVRRFVIDNAALVDFRKVDKFWLIDLLASRGGADA